MWSSDSTGIGRNERRIGRKRAGSRARGLVLAALSCSALGRSLVAVAWPHATRSPRSCRARLVLRRQRPEAILDVDDSLVLDFEEFATQELSGRLRDSDLPPSPDLFDESDEFDESPEERWTGRDKGAQTRITFGKHEGLTYRQCLQEEPNFCRWVVDAHESGDSVRSQVVHFGEWLVEQHKAEDLSPGFRSKISIPVEDSDFNMSSRRLGFGRFKESTYAQVMEERPCFCRWVLRTHKDTDGRPGSGIFGTFAEWLLEQKFEERRRELTFGKHEGMMYLDALHKEPGYCKWVLFLHRFQAHGSLLPEVTKFAEWLMTQVGPRRDWKTPAGFSPPAARKVASLAVSLATEGESDRVVQLKNPKGRSRANALRLQKVLDIALELRRLIAPTRSGGGDDDGEDDDGEDGDGEDGDGEDGEDGEDGDDGDDDEDDDEGVEGDSPLDPSRRKLGFGKHSDLTYEQALRQETAYCRRTLRSYRHRLACSSCRSFVKWLRENIGSPRAVSAQNSAPAGSAPGANATSRPSSPVDLHEVQLGFGEHSDLTYEQALRQEPRYCEWVLGFFVNQTQIDTVPEEWREEIPSFVEWLRQNIDRRKNFKLGFGKHSDLTYEQALRQETAYCRRTLRSYRRRIESVRWEIGSFVKWLEENMDSLEENIDCRLRQSSDNADSASTVAELSDSVRVLDFGIHKGLTYRQAVADHADYCQSLLHRRYAQLWFAQWLQERLRRIHQRQEPEADEAIGSGDDQQATDDRFPDFASLLRVLPSEVTFLRWLIERGGLPKPSRECAVMGFGKHKRLTYDEVLRKHKGFVELFMKKKMAPAESWW